VHSDLVIKNLFLNQFLIEAKKRWNISQYVWRAEKQLNGNIHFHILTNRFIPWSELRDVWNRIQEKLGYVSRYRENLKQFHSSGFKPRPELFKHWPLDAQRRAYFAGLKSDWNNPNSTDIHSLRHVHNVRNYIIKYLSKNDLERTRFYRIKFLDECLADKIPLSDDILDEYENLLQYFNEGRIWGCSSELINITGAREVIDSEINTEIRKIQNSQVAHQYSAEHFSILFINAEKLQELECTRLFSLFGAYMAQEFNYNIETKVRMKLE
jgi:hypothetical protein